MMSSRRSWFPAILASTSLATALVLAAATAEETKPAAATNPHPDAAYKVVQLRLVPSQVEFSNPRDYRRVLVLGKVEGVGEIDLSSGAARACRRLREGGRGPVIPRP